MFIQSDAYMLAALTALKPVLLGSGTPEIKVKLAQTPFSPSPVSVPATDFTEATYTGYAAGTITTLSPNSASGAGYETNGTTIAAFQPTGTTVTNSIGGYWLEAFGGLFLGYEVFDTPIAMNSTLSYLGVAVRWQVMPTSWPNTVLP